jgi:hypothetical protein
MDMESLLKRVELTRQGLARLAGWSRRTLYTVAHGGATAEHKRRLADALRTHAGVCLHEARELDVEAAADERVERSTRKRGKRR